MRRLSASILPLLLVACAGAGASARAPSEEPATSRTLRPAELARVRCLLLAPLDNAADAPTAAAVATRALENGIDRARTQVLPVAELRALFAETPLELPEGVGGATALELAELLRADAALYGAVEGRSHGWEPGMVVSLRLTLTGSRDLLFADTAPIVPAPREPFDAAVRRTVLDLARPALMRLGAAGPRGCFPRERREAVTAAAQALRPPPPPAPAPAPPPPIVSPVEEGPARSSLRTPRQSDWARRLAEKNRLPIDDVAFVGRTAELSRDAGLVDLATVLAATPALTVRLEAFVDATSDPAADLRLSQAMAQAVARRLAELGAEPGRVTFAGRGGESPVAPTFTVRGRAANRRIEAVAAGPRP
jgi:outer membrane protein OmpA-like peptidoglycan-associated protein